MAAEPWLYVVPYQPDLNKALAQLRRREFEAGRYFPAQLFPGIPKLNKKPPPGAQHKSIKAAIEAAGEEGTKSILDMTRVATDSDDVDHGVVSPLPEEELLECFGTTQPTRRMVDENIPIGTVDRGYGIYVIIYKDGKPAEICFAGYSYD